MLCRGYSRLVASNRTTSSGQSPYSIGNSSASNSTWLWFYNRRLSFNRHAPDVKAVDVGSKKMSLAFATGLLAGSLGGIMGLGGGFIALPMLTGPIGLTSHLAHGTSMMSVLFTSVGGGIAYSRAASPNGNDNINMQNDRNNDGSSYIDRIFDNMNSTGMVDLPVAVGTAIASAMFAVVGAKLSTRLSSDTLRVSRGLMQMCIAPTILIKDTLKNSENLVINTGSLKKGASDDDKTYRIGKSLAIGAFAGLQAGIFGVGGGAILVPCFCIGLDLDYKVAIGTSLASMVPTAISGGMVHYLQGTMLTRLGLPLGIGSLMGSYASGSIVPYINDEYLKYAFTGLIFSIGAKTLFVVKKVVK